MWKPFSVIFALTLLAFCRSCDATSIVFVQYPGGYAIGADSVRLAGDNYVPGERSFLGKSEICKLRMGNGVVVATYGSAGWGPGSRTTIKGKTFDIPDLRLISDRILTQVRKELMLRALLQELSSSEPFLAASSRTPALVAGWVYVDATMAVPGKLVIHGDAVQHWLKPEKADTLAISNLAKPLSRRLFPLKP